MRCGQTVPTDLCRELGYCDAHELVVGNDAQLLGHDVERDVHEAERVRVVARVLHLGKLLRHELHRPPQSQEGSVCCVCQKETTHEVDCGAIVDWGARQECVVYIRSTPKSFAVQEGSVYSVHRKVSMGARIRWVTDWGSQSGKRQEKLSNGCSPPNHGRARASCF